MVYSLNFYLLWLKLGEKKKKKIPFINVNAHLEQPKLFYDSLILRFCT